MAFLHKGRIMCKPVLMVPEHLFNTLYRLTTKKTLGSTLLALSQGNDQWLGNSSHKWPLMWKALQCNDLNIWNDIFIIVSLDIMLKSSILLTGVIKDTANNKSAVLHTQKITMNVFLSIFTYYYSHNNAMWWMCFVNLSISYTTWAIIFATLKLVWPSTQHWGISAYKSQGASY